MKSSRPLKNTSSERDFPHCVAAVSGAMQEDRAAYERFCRQYGTLLNGRPGLNSLCVSMAQVFASTNPQRGNDTGGWLESITRYVRLVLAQANSDPSTDPRDEGLLGRMASVAHRLTYHIHELPTETRADSSDEVLRYYIVEVEPYEGDESYIQCGRAFGDCSSIFVIVAVRNRSRAVIVDNGYYSYREAKQMWPDAQ